MTSGPASVVLQTTESGLGPVAVQFGEGDDQLDTYSDIRLTPSMIESLMEEGKVVDGQCPYQRSNGSRCAFDGCYGRDPKSQNGG